MGQMSLDLFDSEPSATPTPVTSGTISLRPYQEEALARIEEGCQRGVRKQLGVAATGLGKGLMVGTKVLKSDGSWCPVENLEVGDFVVGADGQPTKIEGVFFRGEQPCFEVTTDDGASVVVDADHLWTVATDSDITRGLPWRTLKTADLYCCGITSSEGQLRWRLPVVAPIEFDAQPELPIDPYILGVILGDGFITQTTVGFCPRDTWIADKVETLLPKDLSLEPITSADRATSYHIKDSGSSQATPNRMKSALADLGLLGLGSLEKFIPDAYLTASVADRRALLAGLMDCDGWIDKSTVQFTTSSPRLASDLKRLAESVGAIVCIDSKIPSYTYRDEKLRGARVYVVNLRGGGCPFTLPRKVDAWVQTERLGAVRKIESIVPMGPRETVCIKVSADDGLFVTEHHIVTHNTIMFSALAQRMNVPTLVLAHRDELISQAADKIRQVWPDADIGVVKAERNEIDHQVVVASVQTLARSNRREQIPTDKFGLVIIDEAHHAKAASYINIIEHLKAGDEDGPLLVGVTATPDRGDGKGLVDVFDEITFTYDMLWGIRSGYLSDLRGLRVYLDADFSKVKIRKGDYDAGQAGQMLEDADAPSLIADAWIKYAQDRKTIVFTPTVATAEMVTAELIGRGVSASMVSGDTPIDERRDILARYAKGEIRVIANCAVLTEGFDDPSTSCIVVARPTQSRALYTQMIGRGTRRHPDKHDCLVIDVVGASTNHSLVTIPSLFGIKKENPFENAERTVAEAMDEQVEDEIKRGELKATEADLFRKVLESPIAWVQYSNRLSQTCYLCFLGDKEVGSVVIEPICCDDQPTEVPTRYHCFQQWESSFVPVGQPGVTLRPDGSGFRTLITNVDLELAQGVGEDFIRKNGAAALTDRNAAWRKARPSQKQLDFAKTLGIVVDPSWNKGQVSDAISARKEALNDRRRNRPAWAKNKGRNNRR